MVEVGWLYLIVQSSGTTEQWKVERNSPLYWDAGEPLVVEVLERGSMDFEVVLIHRVHRKAVCFH
jgi:hypothetical protein